jgi:hypothetical protein
MYDVGGMGGIRKVTGIIISVFFFENILSLKKEELWE